MVFDFQLRRFPDFLRALRLSSVSRVWCCFWLFLSSKSFLRVTSAPPCLRGDIWFRLRLRRSALICVICGLLSLPALAHVNSPDVYYDGYAGPYHLLVTVRPPAVIPGVAEIEIRSASPDINQVEILPLRIVGPGARLAPRSDVADRSAADPQLFTGKLWIMARGSWKVQVTADGAKGKGELAVPIAAVSANSATMQKALGGLLAALGMLLVAGMVGIIGAANRDAGIDPGGSPSPAQRRRGAIAMTSAAIGIVVVLVLANSWWKADASENARYAYKLPQLQLALQPGNVLQLGLSNPNDMSWRPFRSELEDPDRLRLDDLIPDHGHLMHLFLVRMPDMKSFWHLHPEQVSVGNFSVHLPSVPAGRYKIFSDIVHHTGFPETQVGELDLTSAEEQPVLVFQGHGEPAPSDPCNLFLNQKSEIKNQKSACDDSGAGDLSASENISQLSDGYRMVWERDSAPLKTNQATWFRFRVEDKSGKPATDLEPYMGMAGHAVFIRSDGQIFAHVHPAGSVSMAAVELAETRGAPGTATMPPMTGMSGGSGVSSSAVTCHLSPVTCSEVTFPYGFPKPGDYHIFVQIKRAGHVETGSFIAHVEK